MIAPKFQAGHDQNEPTSVYVMTCGGRVKIGIAANVEARRGNLQLSCPLPVLVALARRFPTRTAARLVERSLHARFGERRLHGEWFELEAEEAMAAVQEAPEIAAPVTIPQRQEPLPAPKLEEPRRVVPAAPIERDGPTWGEFEAMDDRTWVDFMRPAACVLDFDDPERHDKARALEAGLRVKYPQYYGSRPSGLNG